MIRSSSAISFSTHAVRQPRRSAPSFQHNAFFLILAFVLLSSFLSLNIRPDALSVYLPTTVSFLAVGIFSFWGLYDAAREKAFSLNTSHWTYVLFFLFYAPFVQFLIISPPTQTELGIFDQYALWANCLILSWCFVYYLFYPATLETDLQKSSPTKESRVISICSPLTYFLVVLLCLMSFGALYIIIGIEAVFLRGATSQLVDNSNDKSTYLLVGALCRGLPVILSAMLLLTRGRNSFLHWATFSFSLFFTLLLNNPIAVPRFWFGCIVLGFICSIFYIRRVRWSGLWLALTLTLAGLTIFPILSATRYAASADELGRTQTADDGWSANLTSADFDGYTMIISTVEWVKREGATNGMQFIGNSLFFVPRALWYEKPYGSGQMVGEYFNMININLDEPMIAEAYINFGIIGVPAYAFLLARLFAYSDKSYWKKEGDNSQVSTLQLAYPFITALSIYSLRGDYISGLSFTVTLLFLSAFVTWLFRTTALRDTPLRDRLLRSR